MTAREQLGKEQLVDLVRFIINPPEHLSSDDLYAFEQRFSDAIPHPAGSDLINYPDHWGLPSNMTPEEVVEAGLSWKPRALTLEVTDVRRHPSDNRLQCYEVAAEGTIRTQVVASTGFAKTGQIVVVALSGCRLRDGTEVTHSFVGRAFCAGRLLELASLPPGVDVTGSYCS